MRLGIVRLCVADFERSLDYYHRRLKLSRISREDDGAVLGTEDGAALIALRERPGARPVPHTGVLGLFHFAILVPDRAALGRFLTHMAGEDVHVASADHLVSEAVYLWDPDGLGIEVYADRPRSQWQWSEGELVMTTDPLDLASVARAGGGVPWSGFPPETTIGHMHLQVGDLDRARAFYHGQLGLDITVSRYPGALFMSVVGYHHHLGVNTWARRPRPATEDDARLIEWEMLMPGAKEQSLVDPWGTPLRVRPI